MKPICKTLTLIITLITLLVPARAETLPDWLFDPTPAAEAATPAPTPGIPDADLEDDGLLRVWLKSLNDPEALHLTLAGSYALEGSGGFYFHRDAQIALAAADGDIWLTAGGLTVNLGPAATLTRHATEGDAPNGLYIDESEKHALYCGDLSVYVTASGRLRAILEIPVEEYLLGVVAYEMSDSFPIEALKAQAVAARTYAMQRKWAAGQRRYHLVDTTADQVYKGYDPEYAAVAEAVAATRGVVCTYKGGFATCYYTASNGGQTALPSQIWGSEDDEGYLAMTDDPYDTENPYSLENDLSFTAECQGSAKLKSMLEAALAKIMPGQGYDDWTLDSIAAIEPVEPRFPGSRMCDALAFDLNVKVPESALATPSPVPSETPGATPADLPPEPEKWARLDETQRVTLRVFDDIKEGLSMGLNGTDCELISVETQSDESGTATAFRLVMRRYGHGVGMSQRGAQQMAGEHGMDYMEILNFYYPGVSVQRMTWPDMTLQPLQSLPVDVTAARPRPTPVPTPAPLPALKPGERYARVAASSLNVRERPTTASRVVDVLDQGQRVIVSGEPDAEGWVSMHTAELEGFVKLEYLDPAAAA